MAPPPPFGGSTEPVTLNAIASMSAGVYQVAAVPSMLDLTVTSSSYMSSTITFHSKSAVESALGITQPTWEHYRTYCQGLAAGADIASILSASEQQMACNACGNRRCYIGATQTGTQEGFEGYAWADGSSWTYTHEDNDGARNLNENVIAIRDDGLVCTWDDFGQFDRYIGFGGAGGGALCKALSICSTCDICSPHSTCTTSGRTASCTCTGQ